MSEPTWIDRNAVLAHIARKPDAFLATLEQVLADNLTPAKVQAAYDLIFAAAFPGMELITEGHESLQRAKLQLQSGGWNVLGVEPGDGDTLELIIRRPE